MTNPYTAPKSRVDDSTAEQPGPAYFAVSRLKLALMSVATFGLYQIYWFYKNWKAMQSSGESLNAPVRALFYPLTAYWLFRHIGERGVALGMAAGFSAGLLAVAVFLLSMLWRLPDPWWLAGFASVAALLPVQTAVNEINYRMAPDADPNTRFRGWNIFGLIVGGILFGLVVLGAFAPGE